MANRTSKNTKGAKGAISKTESKVIKALIFIPIVALLFKLSIISKLQQLGFSGSDFENYFNATNGLLKDGFFSEEPLLSYFPAGYPLLIWPIALISIDGTQTILSVIQSIFFAFATYFFTNKLRKSNIGFLAVLSSILISFNPTLSLATLTVGYEATVAACFMIAAGILSQQQHWMSGRKRYLQAGALSAWLGLATFLQPRYLLASLALILVLALFKVNKVIRVRLAVLSLAVLFMFPAVLIVRNAVAIDQATISNNLGVTMRIGAGEETNGSYLRTGPEVPCNLKPGTSSVSDGELVKCVLAWYARNPVKAAELSFNKARFFWNPWTGPLVNGTVGRNPALAYSPVMSLNRSSESWNSFIYGAYGKLISYLWLLGQLFLLVIGFRFLLKVNRRMTWIFSIPILTSMMISMATIGDSRFRIPTMSLSLVIQAAGIIALKRKIVKVV
jgi:hypothetical protein